MSVTSHATPSMDMYRAGKPARGPPPPPPPPPPCGPPTRHASRFRLRAPCGVPPPGHLPPASCGPFSVAAADSLFIPNSSPRAPFITPPCSSFPIDCSTVFGGSQQIRPAEPRHTQVPQWNPTPVERQPLYNSDQAGEEFLRCIAANKPLPDYLKGNMAYNLADAFESANALKEAVKTVPDFKKHATRSRSRSRGRSRGRFRGKSRARSRSRGKSKSRVRGKSRARSKSRAHSRSLSRSEKDHIRSKSRARRSRSRSSSERSHGKDKKRKRSPSPIPRCSSSSSSSSFKGNRLLEGLKLVMNSKELEERMPTLKDAILTIQACTASGDSKEVARVSDEQRQQQDTQDSFTSLENDSMVLPHDRVGSDFSWLQARSQEDSTVHKTDELEDEESFLYGNEDTRGKQANKSSAPLFAAFSQVGEHAKPQEIDRLALGSPQHHQNKSKFSSSGDLFNVKQPLQKPSPSLASGSLDSSQCEMIKNVLKNMGTTDISEMMVKMQEPKEGKSLFPAPLSSDSTAAVLPALSDPNVRQALESLQSLIKATKEKRTKRDGNGTSQTSSDKHKAMDDEERKGERQARMSKMEVLMKELEGLLNQDGLSFLTPVIGFYCKKCEEFIGDLNGAENHATIDCHSNSSSMDRHAGDSKGQLHNFSNSGKQHPSERKDYSDDYPRDSRDHRNYQDYQQHRRDESDHRGKHDDHHRVRQESTSLQEEMRKERLLITVSRTLTPPTNVRVKEEVNKEQQASRSHGKVDDADIKGKFSKNSSEKDCIEKDASSDDDKGNASKAKHSKKKKKKKEKKQKKEKRHNS